MSDRLYESINPETRQATRVEQGYGEGLRIVHHQNTKPVVESAKAVASSFDPTARRDTVHVARIPLGIYRQLERLGITKDRAAFHRWLNDPDNAVFRTDDRSKL